jgi:hypothetical protein
MSNNEPYHKENEMKKIVFAFTVLTLLLTLVACGKTSSSTDSTNDQGSLSLEMQLLVGTFKLEDTELAVSADQAEQLLPLWQTLQSLSTSGTAATEEIDAVVNQIKSTMTSQQMDKITAMKLTQQDMMSLMSQAGVFSNGDSSATPPVALDGFPSGGDMPSGGGGMPSGGGDAPGGGPRVFIVEGGGDFPAGGGTGMGGVPGDASSTPQAIRSNGMADRVPAPLLNALIELLQKKVQQ